MESIAAEAAVPRMWRMLESAFITRVVGESTFDFYARVVNPRLTARKVVARVEAVRAESSTAKSFVLRPNGHFRGFRAGQHVNVTVEIDGVRHTRCYSPSNAPDRTRGVVLTIKRQPNGRVSQWMHDRVEPGDFVEIGQAFGDFVLPAGHAGKLFFVAGGSGITPIASMLRDLDSRMPAFDAVVLAYARTYSDLVFAEELKSLARRHSGARVHFAITREAAANGDLPGRFSREHVDAVVPDVEERRTFVCGPPTLVDSARSLWAARGLQNLLKTETFAPAEATTETADGAPVRVNALRSARSFPANTASSLLVQAERAGLSPESGCRQGICFSCTCRKRTGVVQNLSTGAISSEPDEDIRLCVSAPLSDVTLDL